MNEREQAVARFSRILREPCVVHYPSSVYRLDPADQWRIKVMLLAYQAYIESVHEQYRRQEVLPPIKTFDAALDAFFDAMNERMEFGEREYGDDWKWRDEVQNCIEECLDEGVYSMLDWMQETFTDDAA